MVRECDFPPTPEEMNDSDSWESDFSLESEDDLPHFQVKFAAVIVACEGDVSQVQVPEEESNTDDESSDEDYLQLHEESDTDDESSDEDYFQSHEEESITEPCMEPSCVQRRQDLSRCKELLRMRMQRNINIIERMHNRLKR